MAKKKFALEITLTDKLSKRLRQVSKRLARFSAQATSVGKSISLGLTVPSALFAAKIIKVGASFENVMLRVQFLTKTTEKQHTKTFNKMVDTAKKLGSTTQFSATQAAQGMEILAQSGKSPEQIIKLLPNVLNLATAGVLEMSEAASIAINSMGNFGLSAKDSTRIVNTLVSAATSGATNIAEMGEAITKVGVISKIAGFSIEQASATLSILSQGGLKGGLAGRGLKNVLKDLLTIGKRADSIKALGGLGIKKQDLFDTKGNLQKLSSIIAVFAKKGLGQAELFRVFGAIAAPSVGVLLEQFKKGNTIDKMTAKIKKSGNIAERFAKKSMEGLTGAMRSLISAAEGLALEIGAAGLLKDFTKLALEMTDVVRAMAKTNPALLRAATIMVGLAATLGPLVLGLGLLSGAFIKVGVAMKLLLIASPIIIAIGLVAAAGWVLVRDWDKIMAGLESISIASSGEIFGAIGTLIVQQIDLATKKYKEFVEGAKVLLTPILESLDIVGGQKIKQINVGKGEEIPFGLNVQGPLGRQSGVIEKEKSIKLQIELTKGAEFGGLGAVVVTQSKNVKTKIVGGLGKQNND